MSNKRNKVTMEPLSKNHLRARMETSRAERIQTAVKDVYHDIQRAADDELTEVCVRIITKGQPHIMLFSARVDSDIVNEVLIQLQPLLGDIETHKIEDTIHFRW
jgi:hypothetical protein